MSDVVTAAVIRESFASIVREMRRAVADFHAVIGTCRVAERRLRAVIERYGPAQVTDAVDATIGAAERRMRAAIAGLPDGCDMR